MTSVERSPVVGENTVQDVSIVEDMFSATSTSCTSCSYVSYNMKINNTQLYIQPIHGHTADCCLENATATNANIGSISVQNATDVTFGNKTFFNGPVVIKQLVVDYAEPNADPSKSSKKKTKPRLWRRILRSFRKNPRLICSFIAIFAVTVITLVITAYFLDLFGECVVELPTCVEGPSSPSHYTCGYASGCSRCKGMYPDKEVCESYYEPDCGNLRCFCEPNCLNTCGPET